MMKLNKGKERITYLDFWIRVDRSSALILIDVKRGSMRKEVGEDRVNKTSHTIDFTSFLSQEKSQEEVFFSSINSKILQCFI